MKDFSCPSAVTSAPIKWPPRRRPYSCSFIALASTESVATAPSVCLARGRRGDHRSPLCPANDGEGKEAIMSTAVSILDRELTQDVVSAQRGDRPAFGRLVGATRNTICSISLAVVRDVPRSEEVAQDVLVAAWRGLPRLRNPRSFWPWIRCGWCETGHSDRARRPPPPATPSPSSSAPRRAPAPSARRPTDSPPRTS